ncbi:MAG: hypothetical protein D6752_04615, partial [Candidatus Nitrosothermus koennekii]
NVKNKNAKINEIEAYEFIDVLMKNDKGREELKNSKFNQVLEEAFKKIDKLNELKEAWQNK